MFDGAIDFWSFLTVLSINVWGFLIWIRLGAQRREPPNP